MRSGPVDGGERSRGGTGGGGQGLPQQAGVAGPGRGGRRTRDRRAGTEAAKVDRTERAEQAAVYANRRRLHTKTAKALMRRRGELIERSFAHLYDTGGMRRVHLRKKEQHRQTRPDSRRSLQSEPDPAADAWSWDRPAGGGPSYRALFLADRAQQGHRGRSGTHRPDSTLFLSAA